MTAMLQIRINCSLWSNYLLRGGNFDAVCWSKSDHITLCNSQWKAKREHTSWFSPIKCRMKGRNQHYMTNSWGYEVTVSLWFILQYRKECVAVLIGLYKKNGAVICVGFDLLSDCSLYGQFHSYIRQGCGHVLASLNIRSWHGQFPIESATHSLCCSILTPRV